MGVIKRDRVILPSEPRAVVVRGVDREEDEVTLFFERTDGTKGEVTLSSETFNLLGPLHVTGAGDPKLALAGLWGRWIQRVIANIRQSTLATAPLHAYAHQDEAVFEYMLPQATLRYLLADEPGTGKTIMTGMYIAEMRRQGLLNRVLLVVPAHLVPKWERDLQRFFGLETEQLTAEVGRSSSPLRPDRDLWVVSIDLLARNHQVQRKAILDKEGAWDLVVFDEAHRLTPTAQNIFPMAEELAKRSTHLLLLTATPHRGSEYLFRALLHLLDPDLYPWNFQDERLLGPDTPRLRPARIHFIRRMKENLRDYDNITPLFPERHAHNVSIFLSATEQQLYEDVLSYCDLYFDDDSGLVKSVYGRIAASSLYALSETLSRRIDRLQSSNDAISVAHGLKPLLNLNDLRLDDDEEQSNLEQRVNAVHSKNIISEIKVIKELRSRIASLLSDPAFSSAKWEEISQNVLPLHAIAPGKQGQLLVFTEFVSTAIWLEQLFLNQGFTVRRYAGDVSREDRERIQTDFQDKKFEVLISTDAGNEGIDLQSAHVLVNWDIPWSIVRLEQRVGRLHRIGQRSKVDIYNLISASTHEGRVQEVVLNNIVTAAEALNGQIFDFLGSVFEQLGIDYTGLLVRAGGGGQATEDAVARVKAITAEQYKISTEEQRYIENKLATLANSDTFLSHNLQDRLDAVNPAIVTGFMRALSDARGWRMMPGLHEDLYVIQASNEINALTKTLPPSLGGGTHAYIAVLVDALIQARREGADLAKAIVLGPAEPAYKELVYDIIRDTDDVLAIGAVLDDPSALTPYELLIFDTALVRRQNGRIVEWPNPLLIRADGSGVRVVAWQSIAHLRAPSSPQSHADFSPGFALQAEVVAVSEIEREVEHASNELHTWATTIAEQLDRLQDEVVEPYQNLPRTERVQRRAAVANAVTERKRLLRESIEVTNRPMRLIGRVYVRAIGSIQEGREDSNSEAISMLMCMLHLEAEGFHVEDVHQEGRGYDLYAKRGYEQRCVEVKGLKSDESPGIMLEASEWLMAQQLGEEYWVYVFTYCASDPKLFGAYRNPVALFGDNKKLIQRFHITASTLRRVLIL